MIRKLGLAFVCAIALPAAAQAAVVVDGALNGLEGYTHTSSVAYNPSAITSNFTGSPGPQNNALVGYDVYLAAQNGYVYGLLQAGTGTLAGTFANLYWNIDPANPGDQGSDIGFQLSEATQNFFIPGVDVASPASGITVVASADGKTIEFAIPNYYFTSFLPGQAYWGDTTLASIGSQVQLRSSQSFSYSVGGGSSYGPTRLGQVTLAAAVPEPGTWAMMIGGFGLAGGMLRRRRKDAGALATA